MTTITMATEDFADLCVDRLETYWTDDPDIRDLFFEYYLNTYDGADVTESIPEIVDNDWINNFYVISQEDIDDGSAEQEYGDIEDRIVYSHNGFYLISTH